MKVGDYFVYEYILNCIWFLNMVHRWLFSDPILCLESLQLFYWLQWWFASCLKILHISFLIASTCLGDFVQVASPSSLHNPTLTSRWVSWDNKNSPPSSQVSAPSNGRSSEKWSHSHQVIKCANFAYKKNYPSLGLHHLWIKEAKFLDSVSIGKKNSCLAIPTIHCQPIRSPM